ncbi:hypothetical protein TrRE_jg10863 [Triparma retinervis]|uniref:protein-tyrosine-phosphatase n=1 Tax=Triparma retinervis TaxID=2557542 RepID=A0A9W7L1F9_9STRA|nr:hypothetical protein TrRE_jg10863 [Triparma retinervis]
MHLGLEDNAKEDISMYFDSTTEFIDAVAALPPREGSAVPAVLVHCHSGMSRSVTVCMAYLMGKGRSLIEAFEMVKSTRQQASPNAGFMEQLAEYERELTGREGNTLDLEKYQMDRFSSVEEVRVKGGGGGGRGGRGREDDEKMTDYEDEGKEGGK